MRKPIAITLIVLASLFGLVACGSDAVDIDPDGLITEKVGETPLDESTTTELSTIPVEDDGTGDNPADQDADSDAEGDETDVDSDEMEEDENDE